MGTDIIFFVLWLGFLLLKHMRGRDGLGRTMGGGRPGVQRSDALMYHSIMLKFHD
jgi:hypothetical protein